MFFRFRSYVVSVLCICFGLQCFSLFMARNNVTNSIAMNSC